MFECIVIRRLLILAALMEATEIRRLIILGFENSALSNARLRWILKLNPIGNEFSGATCTPDGPAFGMRSFGSDRFNGSLPTC